MKFTFADHNKVNKTSGFKTININFKDVPEYVRSTGYCSNEVMDGMRSKNEDTEMPTGIEAYQGNEDILILDIDEGITIPQAFDVFEEYELLIITTKSHHKIKNGVMQGDRFRVFIPFNRTLDDFYDREILINYIYRLYNFVDSNVKNANRFFYASPADAEVFVKAGKPLDIDYIIKHAIEISTGVQAPNAIKTGKKSNKTKNVSKGVYKWDEIEEIWKNEYGEVIEREVMDSVDASLKGAMVILDEEFHSGNHSNCLFKVSVMLKKEDGLDDDRIVDFLMNENKVRGGSKVSKALHNIKSGLK